MPPPHKRTITLLEAHSTSSSTAVETESSDDFRASTTEPSTSTPQSRTASSKITTSSSSRTRSRRPRPTNHAPSSHRAREPPISTSGYVPTVTEYTSITTTSSTGGFATSTRPHASASITISGPPVRREKFEIPDPPTWFPYLIAALLLIMTILAVLFYFANFPPTGRMWRRWREGLVVKRTWTSTSPTLREMDDLSTSKKDDDDAAAGFTTSTNTPGLHNTPTLYSRRRKREDGNITTGNVTGLGITLAVDASSPGPTLRRQKSFDDGLLRPNMDKPLPKTPRSPALQSARAFFSSTTHKKKSPVDLESGLQKPSSSSQRPSVPPVVAETAPPPSPGMRVLEMVGGSVEYAAEKMSRFMYDQVKGHPEEGLLLPVRDCEREKKGLGV